MKQVQTKPHLSSSSSFFNAARELSISAAPAGACLHVRLASPPAGASVSIGAKVCSEAPAKAEGTKSTPVNKATQCEQNELNSNSIRV